MPGLETALLGEKTGMLPDQNMPSIAGLSIIEFEPPLVGCVISNRSHTFVVLRRTRECVISNPTMELAAKVVKCGNSQGRTVDKFETYRLTPMPASQKFTQRISWVDASLVKPTANPLVYVTPAQ
jgi:Flavin reductase like domain